MSTTLGLDLGPNSIGWALIDSAQQKIIDLGVRIFPEGIDNFDTNKEKSRNEDRRLARAMRRQILRRVRRKRRLRAALIEADLWPQDHAEQAQLESCDPYALRARAVDPSAPPLTRHELGRVILHLNQRRGFLSNRKDTSQANAKETQGMLAEISALARDMGSRTLGQYLHEKNKTFDPVRHNTGAEGEQRVRHRHTRRQMLHEELLAIARRHPEVLTDQLLYGQIGPQSLAPGKPRRRERELKGLTPLQAFGIHGIIFFQRSLYWPKSMVGLCELEPKEKRSHRAERLAQRFRMLQEVNNLRYIDPDTHAERALTPEQRTLLLEKLATREKMDFDAIRQTLGFLESVKFNLEQGERSSLKGHVTDYRLTKAIKRWPKLPENVRDAVVHLLLDPALSEDELVHQLTTSHALTVEEAQAAAKVDLGEGYLRLSLKAIARLLPHMERGLVYQMTDPTNSAVHAAGYLRPDELQRRIFDTLPDPQRTRSAPIGNIPNPVVRRALVELRKLVNAIIKTYGKPTEIHVEMARQIKQGEELRKRYNQNLREREKRRAQAAEELHRNKIKVTREAINRYLLWEEQEHLCAYSGSTISFAQLFGGEVDVDHILPYSRSLDDSLMNKVVCFRHANQDKADRTPYEWLAASQPKEYDRVCQQARKLPYPKYRRFLLKELVLDSFIARQLVDTSYIARATAEYLRCLMNEPSQVLGVKGELTAELRHQWGLNAILNTDGSDMKSRDDHRHHAIDAVVVALTNRSRLQQLTRIRKSGGVRNTGEALDFPWPTFRDELCRRIAQVNVSHRVERKVSGPLHEETFYAQHRNDAGQVVDGEFVVRKPLESLSPNEIALIRDPAVRQAVEARLAKHGIDVGRGKKVSSDAWKAALGDPQNPVRLQGRKTGKLGPPILKVRVIRKEQTIQPIRNEGHTVFVKPGSTHHLSLFEFTQDGKVCREAVWTSMLEAAQRLRRQAQLLAQARQQLEKDTGRRIKAHDPRLGVEMRRIAAEVPLITRTHPKRPEAKFLFSLSRGEMVQVELDGKKQLLVYNTSASTSGQMWFYLHTDARPKSAKDPALQRRKYSFSAKTLFDAGARKVTVDYLGRVRWAND